MTTTLADALPLFLAGLRTEYNVAYHKAIQNPAWQQVATDVKTTLRTQNYAWLGGSPVMEEFKDEVREPGLTTNSYSITDKVFKANLSIERTAIEDDQYEMLMMMARNMAPVSVRFQNKLTFEGLAKGFVTICADKQNMFDTLHPDGMGGTWSNKSSDPLTPAALVNAETQLMTATDDKGEPMDIQPDTLVVGPAYKQTALDITESDVRIINVGDGVAGAGSTTATGSKNYFKGRYSVVVNPYLRGAYAKYWFLMDNSREIKAMVMQTRSDVPATTEDDMHDGAALNREIFNFWARLRCQVGYGLPQLAFGSNFAG